MTSREEAAEAPRTLSPLRASTSRHTQYHPPSWPLDFTCGTRIPSITNKGTRGDDTAQVERTGKAYERVLLGTPCLLLVLGCFASALLSRHFLRPRGETSRAVGEEAGPNFIDSSPDFKRVVTVDGGWHPHMKPRIPRRSSPRGQSKNSTLRVPQTISSVSSRFHGCRLLHSFPLHFSRISLLDH